MARRLLEHRRDTCCGDQAPVFASGIGAELHPSNVRGRVLVKASKPLGLEWVGFHTFRHTCASLRFEGGKSVKQVQEWLGHADPGFTLRTYVHLLDDGLGRADFLDEVVTRAEVDRSSSSA
jgi:integrase